jgi:hypothetical protein
MRIQQLLPILLVCLFALTLEAQQPADTFKGLDNAFVQKEFGTSCTIYKGVQPAEADLNGDGIADIVIAARCTDPMMDQGQFDYTVIDPYFSFYGYGNPAVTTQYTTELPEYRSLTLLIIQGVGKDAWHADAPKQKFLIVNLPYKQISVKKIKFKKKHEMAIYALESGSDQMTSAIVWDGKKYRYLPVGASME